MLFQNQQQPPLPLYDYLSPCTNSYCKPLSSIRALNPTQFSGGVGLPLQQDPYSNSFQQQRNPFLNNAINPQRDSQLMLPLPPVYQNPQNRNFWSRLFHPISTQPPNTGDPSYQMNRLNPVLGPASIIQPNLINGI